MATVIILEHNLSDCSIRVSQCDWAFWYWYTMHNFWLPGGLGSHYVSGSYSGEL